MYKVFFNEKLITISGQGNITLNKPTRFFDDLCTVKDVQNWFSPFLEGNVQETVLIHSNPEIFFGLFQSAFVALPAAGGVVLNDNRILFIFRNGKWDLPKGKIDQGETLQEAALREVEEECGIGNLKLVKQLPSTFHIYISPYKKSMEKWIFKETFWFEMDYSGKEPPVPQLDEGITEVKWFARNELDEVLENTYENLKQIILLYFT